MVLDDVAAPADLEGLWPQGPAGRVVVTTRSPVVLKSMPGPLVLPIGAFSSHEALTYLMARLISDPDQRIGRLTCLRTWAGSRSRSPRPAPRSPIPG